MISLLTILHSVNTGGFKIGCLMFCVHVKKISCVCVRETHIEMETYIERDSQIYIN